MIKSLLGRGRRKFLVFYKSYGPGDRMTEGWVDAFTDKLTTEAVEEWQKAISEKHQDGRPTVVTNVIELEG